MKNPESSSCDTLSPFKQKLCVLTFFTFYLAGGKLFCICGVEINFFGSWRVSCFCYRHCKKEVSQKGITRFFMSFNDPLGNQEHSISVVTGA